MFRFWNHGDAANPITLADFSEQFSQARDIEDSTARQYRYAVNAINAYSKSVEGLNCRGDEGIYASDLSPEFVDSWLRWLTKGHLSRHTIRSRRRHILILWRAAHIAGHTQEPPGKLRIVKAPALPPTCWSIDEMREILKVASSLRGYYSQLGCFRSDWWQGAIRLDWDTAVRSCDLFELKSSDIHSNNSIVLVQKKTSRWHVVRIHDSTLRHVKNYRRDDDSRLTPWVMSKNHFTDEFGDIVRKAGLSGTFKRIRSSSASNVEARYPGAGASHLGHVSRQAAVAVNHYLDPRIVAERRPMPEEL